MENEAGNYVEPKSASVLISSRSDLEISADKSIENPSMSIVSVKPLPVLIELPETKIHNISYALAEEESWANESISEEKFHLTFNIHPAPSIDLGPVSHNQVFNDPRFSDQRLSKMIRRKVNDILGY